MLDLGDVEGSEKEGRGGIRILGDQDIRKPGHQGIRISEHQDEETKRYFEWGMRSADCGMVKIDGERA